MSSRSHGIFELRIAKIRRDGGRLKQDATKICKLSMVDLAGSERTKNTQSTGERLREASHINTGLMVGRSKGLFVYATCTLLTLLCHRHWDGASKS